MCVFVVADMHHQDVKESADGGSTIDGNTYEEGGRFQVCLRATRDRVSPGMIELQIRIFKRVRHPRD